MGLGAELEREEREQEKKNGGENTLDFSFNKESGAPPDFGGGSSGNPATSGDKKLGDLKQAAS